MLSHNAWVTTDDLLTSADVLRLTGRSDRSTVSRWVRNGRLEPTRTVGNANLFARADVDRLVAELRAEAQAELARLGDAS